MDISTVEMPQTAVKEKKQIKELTILLENSDSSIYHLLFSQTENGDVKK